MIQRIAAMIMRTIELRSPLSVADCVARLREAIDPPSKLFGSRPVVGRVDNGGFRLHKRIHYRSSFQTHAMARFHEDEAGTRVSCRFGMHPVVLVFFAAWMSIVLVVGARGLVIALGAAFSTRPEGAAPFAVPLAGAVLPLGMLVFGAALVGFGRWLAREEERFLTDFLCVRLEAGGVTPGT